MPNPPPYLFPKGAKSTYDVQNASQITIFAFLCNPDFEISKMRQMTIINATNQKKTCTTRKRTRGAPSSSPRVRGESLIAKEEYG